MAIDITTMLINLDQSVPGLMSLVTGASVLTGFWFALRGVYQMRVYGELRTMTSMQTNLAGPLAYLFVGIALIYWPSMVDSAMLTVFNTSSPLAYQASGMGGDYDLTIQACGDIIKLIGFIAFVRGLVLLTKHGQQQQGGSNTAKAIAHLLGGILAINIYATWEIVKNTLGLG